MDSHERERIVSRWRTCTEFAHIDDFLSGQIPEGVSAISLGRAHLFLRLKKRLDTKRLVVIFGAAAIRGPGRHPPFFNGVAMSEVLNASVLSIDDIAHQYGDDIAIGWHVGTSDVKLQRIIPAVIEHISSQLKSDEPVLTGGSAGGFAALYYGSLLPSIVMAVNPQTDILRYYSRHVRNYLSPCFGLAEGESLECRFTDQVYSLPSYLTGQRQLRAVYFQNESDTHHMEHHALPMLKALGGSGVPRDASHNGVDFYFRNWGQGHAPIPPTSYAACVNHILEKGLEGVAAALENSIKEAIPS